MKVKDLIAMLQDCDQEKEVIIDNDNIINDIQEMFFDSEVVLFTAPKEEEVNDMERDEFFMSLADTLDEMEEVANNFFEVIDSMKINGVR